MLIIYCAGAVSVFFLGYLFGFIKVNALTECSYTVNAFKGSVCLNVL